MAIPTWRERCDIHPDHNDGRLVTHAMIQQRMQEEIDDLRAAADEAEKLLARTPKICRDIYVGKNRNKSWGRQAADVLTLLRSNYSLRGASPLAGEASARCGCWASEVDMAMTKRQLQAALNALAKAAHVAHVQRGKIADHCAEVYGVDPADVDNDSFIDSCEGGCGAASGMTADEFDRSMRECMEMAGIEMPNDPNSGAARGPIAGGPLE